MNDDPQDLRDPDDAGAPSSEFARALESFERGARAPAAGRRAAAPLAPGARVQGRVVAITGDHALLDIAARSEAVVELTHFRNDDGTLRVSVGDELELFVVDAGDQIVLAPSLRADAETGLALMRHAMAAQMPVSGRVTGVNTGGLQVDLGGARGFCPTSQIESGYCSDPAAYVGRTLEFQVTAIEDQRRSVVLSRRQLVRRQEEENLRRRVAEIKPGAELDATVKSLESFGAFVDLGGIDGLVHVSEIQHGRVAHPRDALREGDKVRVRVLRVDAGKDGRPRIAVSIKAAAPDPWTGVEQRFTPGMRVHGVVARIVDFGAFVTLEPGVDGLVHVSQISLQRVERVKDALRVGQEVDAIVLEADPAKKRISLSIRAVLEREGGDVRSDVRSAGKPAATASAEPSPVSSGKPKPPPAAASGEPKTPAASPEPLTTMAIALREAAERARKKQQHSS